MNTFVNYLCNRPVQKVYHSIQRLSKNKHYKFLLIILAFSFLSLVELIGTALLSHGYIRMGDIIFHNERSLELWNEIIHHHLSLVNLYVGYPRGSATNLFYPWLTLLPVVLLRGIIRNPLIWFYTTLILIAFLHYICSFYSYKTYDNNDWHAFIFSLLYSYGAITFWWGYLAEDLGADLAIAFLPIAFFGFLRFLRSYHTTMMTCGILLLLYSHLITALLTVVLLAILYLCDYLQITNKLKSLRHLFIATSCSLVLSLPITVPLLYLMDKNDLSLPANATAFSGGLFDYTPDFFGILIPIFIVLILCLQWHKTTLDWQLFYIGDFSVLINVHWIGKLLLTILPFMSDLQFSIRFNIISNLAFSLIILDFCRSYSAPTSMIRKSIVRASILGLIFVTVPCFEFTTPSVLLNKPKFTNANYRSFITSIAHNHLKPIEYRINSHELQAMGHNTFYTDYMPKRSILSWKGYLNHHLTSGACKPNHLLKGTTVQPNIHGICIKASKSYNEAQLPIVLYHGFSYTLQIKRNHHSWRDLPQSVLNSQQSKHYQAPVLKVLPKGNYVINIKHVRLGE